MREIKFRAWNKIKNKIGIVCSMSLSNTGDFENCVESVEAYTNDDDWSPWEDLDGDDCILMQFTGLLDKNGVEIYEGDIVNNYTGNHIIEDIQEIHLTNSETFNALVYGENEIIGNIHENPELLENKK